jgi:hypothetical protein
MQEQREAAAIPRRKDELEDLVRRQSMLEATLQDRYKALSQRLHASTKVSS